MSPSPNDYLLASIVLATFALGGLLLVLVVKPTNSKWAIAIPGIPFLGCMLFALLAQRANLPNSPLWQLVYFPGVVWMWGSTMVSIVRQSLEGEMGTFKPHWSDAGLGFLLTGMWFAAEYRASSGGDILTYSLGQLVLGGVLVFCLWQDTKKIQLA